MASLLVGALYRPRLSVLQPCASLRPSQFLYSFILEENQLRILIKAIFIFCLILPLQARADIAPGPAMWHLKTNASTITFLGSFHLIPQGLNWHDARVTTALAEADEVIFEVDMVAAADPVFGQRLYVAGSLPEGVTLSQILSPAQMADVSAICATLGVPVEGFQGLKPWFAGMLLSIIYMQAMGFDPEAGVETQLDAAARELGKEIGALETVDDQLNALMAMDDLSVDEVMEDATKEFDDANYLPNMLKYWISGDVAGLDQVILEDMKRFPSVYDALIVKRNANWIAPIEEMVNAGGHYFIVVGAGHLVGEDSVINMLRDKGYVVDRF
jgi:uncharacterized protein YbaP (TraB family)